MRFIYHFRSKNDARHTNDDDIEEYHSNTIPLVIYADNFVNNHVYYPVQLRRSNLTFILKNRGLQGYTLFTEIVGTH